MGNKTSAVVSALPVAPQYGHALTVLTPGQTLTVLASPPSGKVRVVTATRTYEDDDTSPTSTNLVLRFLSALTTLEVANYNPSGTYDGYGADYPPMLFPGDSVQGVSVSGPKDLIVRINYFDLPDTGFFPIRVLTNGTTPVTVVPAAPSGKVNVLFGGIPSGGSAGGYIKNYDSVSHAIDFDVAGERAYHSDPSWIGASSLYTVSIPVQSILGAPLLLKLREVIMLNQLGVFGWYKQYDL